MDIGGNDTQEVESRINESVTLREIVNEARKRAMHERMGSDGEAHGDLHRRFT